MKEARLNRMSMDSSAHFYKNGNVLWIWIESSQTLPLNDVDL